MDTAQGSKSQITKPKSQTAWLRVTRIPRLKTFFIIRAIRVISGLITLEC